MSSMPAAAERFLHPKGHFIDGAFVASSATIPVEDPSTGEPFSAIPAGTAADIDRAVTAARRSFKEGIWSRAEPSHRGRVLWELARKIREHAEALAWIETKDSGKPIV